MSVDVKLTKVNVDSRFRCERMIPHGQCQYEVVEGSKYCYLHGGNSREAAIANEQVRSYRLAKWGQRVNEFVDNPNIKTLREEIGILRMMIESILDKCQTPHDILMYSGKIGDLITRLQKVIESTHRIEGQLGRTLDKNGAINLSEQIVRIIGEHISDPDVMESIAEKIATAILSTGSMKELTT